MSSEHLPDEEEGVPDDLLGVVLAGGENRRYGDHKALSRVGSKRIIERVIDALSRAVPEVVLVANDEKLYGNLGLAVRGDLLLGTGALGGVLTAVDWARETGHRAALVAACDMPFLSGELLIEIAMRAEPDAVVLPASRGPRGIEPLCAAYGVECLEAIERTLRRGDRAMVSALAKVRQRVLPLQLVEAFGDPDLLFLNVNRPADRKRAEEILLAGRPPANGSAGG